MRLATYLRTKGRGTRADLARRVGCQWLTIHKIARGESRPKLQTACRIVSATRGEVTLADLLPDMARAFGTK